ncbi:MAG: hypothetical protein HZA50_07825 [Planctomycetes bacterium]|nr:hypothetical protein [Planctomycetota bacterium]
MYLKAGTNESQFGRIACWTLAALIMFGMLSWWHPSYDTWGAMSAGLMVVLVMWLIWRLVGGDRTLPGNPLQLVVLGPAAVMAWHTASSIIHDPAGQSGMAGAMNASLLYHMGLTALSVMLVQSLLHSAADHDAVVSVAGLSMSLGAMFAVLLTDKPFAAQALVLTCYAGLAVWLTPVWRCPGRRKETHWLPGARQLAVAGRIVFAVAVAAVIAHARPRESLPAIVISAGTIIFCLLAFRFSGWALASVIAVMIGSGATWAILHGEFVFDAIGNPSEAAGIGENAFARLGARDSGLAIVGASTGFAGLIWTTAAFLAAIVLMLHQARQLDFPGRAAAATWACATALIGSAMLGPAGMFMPSVNLALGLTWGLAPAIMGSLPQKRTGLWLAAAMAVFLLLLGLAPNEGLAGWGVDSLGGSDKILHVAAGLLAGLTFAWFAGMKNTWLGALAVIVVVAAGGVGEILQGQFTIRGMEAGDWDADIIGAAAALVIYLLCRGARLCELSPAENQKPVEPG